MTARLRLVSMLSALLVSVLYVRGSQWSGRLSQDLWYDDVSYVTDAAGRLQEGAARGVGPFLATFVRKPPHSPFSTGLAILGLAVFGFTDSAVYYANALVLAATVLLILHLFREERPWLVALFVLVYLSGAFAAGSVSEFRPDLALGMCTAGFLFLLLRGALYQRPREITLSGVLFGTALLIKPSFFGHTLAMLAAGSAILIGYRALHRELVSLRVLLRAAGIGLLIAAPHYLLDGRNVLGYFWTNTRGEEAYLWLFDAGMGFWQVLYQFTIDPRSIPVGFVGRDIYLFLLVVVVGAVYLASRRMTREFLFVAGLVLLAAVSVLIVSLGRMNNVYFASTFQALLMLGSFACLASLVAATATPRKAALGVTVAVLHFVAVMANGAQPWAPPPDAIPDTSWNARVVHAIRADVQQRGIYEDRRHRLRVFITAAGAVNGPTVLWTCQKIGFQALAWDLHRDPSRESIAAAARDADYIVVPNPARAAILTWLPPAGFQEDLLRSFREDSNLPRVPAGTPQDPDRYYVFANLDRLSPRLPVVRGQAVEGIDGFGPEEGPYEQWNLPRVRWLNSSTGRVCFGAPTAGLQLRVSFRAAGEGTLRVVSDGEAVGEFDFRRSDAFQDVAVGLRTSKPHSCIELRVRDGSGKPLEKVLLFRRLGLAKGGDVASGP